MPLKKGRSRMKKEKVYQNGTKKNARKRVIFGRNRQPLP